jgi:tryptophan-rich sensory protein
MAAGAAGSLATASQIRTRYAALQKPDWTRHALSPDGLATWFVWEKPPSLRRRGPMIFWLQLAWNTLRSFLFFG